MRKTYAFNMLLYAQKYASNMPICHDIDLNITSTYKIYTKYAQNMQTYPKKMQIICTNMLRICFRYALKMHKYAIDLNMQSVQKYAENEHKDAKNYAQNMEKICRICMSLCNGIFCIYMHSSLC